MNSVLAFVCSLLFLLPASHAQDAKRIDFLLEKLSNAGDFKVRVAAATELGKIADGSVADWMLQSFKKEKNKAVRLSILSAIGKIPDDRILPALIYATTQTPMDPLELLSVERVLWTFRRVINAEAWNKTLASATSDHEKGLSAWILGLSGDTKVLKSVSNACATSSQAVRAQACRAKELLSIDDEQKKRINPNQSPFIVVNTELKDLPSGVFTMASYQQYAKSKQPKPTQKKENEIQLAAEHLNENAPQDRQAKNVPIMESQDVFPTMRMRADAASDFNFYAQDIAVLKTAMQGRAKNIDDCYLALLQKKIKIGGDLFIVVTVSGDGKAKQVDYVKNSLSNAELRGCVTNVIKTTNFPNTGFKEVKVNYQFTFFPPKDQKINF